MSVILYKVPQRRDDTAEIVLDGAILTIDGVPYDLSAVTEPIELDSDFIVGPVFQKDGNVHVQIVVPYGAGETPVVADPMPARPVVAPPPTPPIPQLFASAGFSIVGGVVGTIEMAAQLTSAYYEEGWMLIAFAHPQDDTDYLVFVQTDVPAKIEQFKDLGSFELVFSDPSTGDPIEPGRIDLQILKVR